MIDPPRTVTTPTPLITGLTPSRAYSGDADVAVKIGDAPAATAGTRAADLSMDRRVGTMTIYYRPTLRCKNQIT